MEQELDPEGIGDTPELREKILSNLLFSGYNMSFSSWSELEDTIQQGPQTPGSIFMMMTGKSEYTNTEMYQWLIQMETGNPDITLKCSNGEEIKVKESGEFLITTNGACTVTAVIENERYEDYYGEESLTISKCVNRKDNQAETYTKMATTADAGKNSKTVTALDNKPVEVPAGFYYGTSSNVGKVSNGFVITDSTDGNGNSTGNEFVWIPVDKTTLKVIGANGELTDKVMAIKDGDNYIGVFYDFGWPEYYNFTNYESREPAIYKYYEKCQDYLGLDESSFESTLISEYNAMIESVKTYGGFYVARYEMGVEKYKMTSKIGVRPTRASFRDNGTRHWYGLYKMAKTYTTSSVQSSMIWGSQYDAMMNFALTGEDMLKVTASNNGMHASDKGVKAGLYEGSDVISNIYDLEGNVDEWTLEFSKQHNASPGGARVIRGGDSDLACPPCNRGRADPRPDSSGYTAVSAGTRVTLYIK